jgi:exopolysaccharide production protein ExoQ
MPPTLALTLTLIFIFYLFKRDSSVHYKPSTALWIPSVWILLLSSRPVSFWFYYWTGQGGSLESVDVGVDALMEGSPIDRTVLLMVMIAGLVVLWRRRISWGQVWRDNIGVTLFLLYCGITVLWSDFPEIAFKRWSKGLGDPIMVLILLSEPEPIKAVGTVLKRCAYVVIPFSILLIKYYPHLGRAYSFYEGFVYYTGVAMDKNVLGFICMTCGLFCVWKLCSQWSKIHESGRKSEMIVPLVLLVMIGWLFMMANSKTSLLCLVLGTSVMVGLQFKNVRQHIGTYIIAGVFVSVLLQLAFSFGEVIIEGAGREVTLTGRTELWQVVLSMAENPLVGEGYQSFWLGERLRKLWNMYFFRPTQAHSGYIDTYLNLGLIGLFFLAAVITSCYRKMRVMLNSSSHITECVNFARFGLGFLAAYLFYNITEAAFQGCHLLFLMFMIFSIKYQHVSLPARYSFAAPLSNNILAGTRN